MNVPFTPLIVPDATGNGIVSESFHSAVAAELSAPAGLPSSSATSSDSKAETEPKTVPPPRPIVTLRRDGDKVTGISVKCSCGEIIELACEY